MTEPLSSVRLTARLALPLIVLLAALLLLICAPRYDGREVTNFFAETCTSMPCWQGIRPDTTTFDEALAILRRHPWVSTITEVYASPKSDASGTVLIYWTWSESYPFGGSSLPQGIIVTDQRLVRQIYLNASIPLGDLWLALGGAQGNVLNLLDDQQRLRLDNTALFVQDGIAATASQYDDCLTELAGFWHRPIYLWLRSNLPLPTRDPVMLQYRQLRPSFC